jgi:hypothetical protein
MLTDSEKKKIQHKKELKSLRNRMSDMNLIWFDSLPINRQYDFLFEWKSEKYFNKIKNPKVRFIRKRKPYRRFETIKIIEYPPSLKHFIINRKDSNKWKVEISAIRNATIDLVLNSKK